MHMKMVAEREVSRDGPPLRLSSLLIGSIAIVASVLALGCSDVKSDAIFAMLQVEARNLPAPRSDKIIEYDLNKQPTQVTFSPSYRTTLSTAAITAYYLDAFHKQGWKLCKRSVSWDGGQVAYTFRKNDYHATLETGTTPKTGEYSVSLSWDEFYVPNCNGEWW